MIKEIARQVSRRLDRLSNTVPKDGTFIAGQEAQAQRRGRKNKIFEEVENRLFRNG